MNPQIVAGKAATYENYVLEKALLPVLSLLPVMSSYDAFRVITIYFWVASLGKVLTRSVYLGSAGINLKGSSEKG